jgi:hypothetical protein
MKNTKQPHILNHQRLETRLKCKDFKNLVHLHKPPCKEDQGAQLVEEESNNNNNYSDKEESSDLEDDDSATLNTAF